MKSKELALYLLLLAPLLVVANLDCRCATDFDEDYRPCDDPKITNFRKGGDLQLQVKNYVATTEAVDPIAHCWSQYPVLGRSKVSLFLEDSSIEKLAVDLKLYSLDLFNSSCAEFVVDEAQEYRLEHFTVGDIQMNEFPKNINKFQNLKFISLERMPTLDMRQLGGLQKLRSIKIKHGCTSWVIDSANVPAVDLINLDHNELEKIPNDISKLKYLQFLYLRSNKITHLDMSIFNGLKHLEYLYLGRNPLKVIDSSSAVNLPALQTLDLQFTQLDQLDVTNWQMPKLDVLNLSVNNLTQVTGLESSLPRVVLRREENPWDKKWLSDIKKKKTIRI